MRINTIVFFTCFIGNLVYGQAPAYDLPIEVGVFDQQFHHPFTIDDGLPDKNIKQIKVTPQGQILAKTAMGVARLVGHRFESTSNFNPAIFSQPGLDADELEGLQKLISADIEIRNVAEYNGELAVAANTGLYVRKENNWRLVLPRQDSMRWAPVDVRAVAYDASGSLCFAAPQGVGYRISEGNWKLYTGAEGLPFNDFTCIATGPRGVWFGTTNGAIQHRDGEWSFRQGRRWLLNNHVNDISIDEKGNAWIATPEGVSCIAYQFMTLARKAAYFENDIEKYHRRTPYGYVNPAKLSVPGDKNTAIPAGTANDGQRIGIYLAAMSLGYAATGDPRYKQLAKNAFDALVFLSIVTEGGTHPAPKGFFARAVRPTSGPDPNPDYDLSYDLRRRKADTMWKIIQPRWPVDESGEWYWMNDGSVDELDGHFLGYGTYFDHVCETEAEREQVRKAVRNTIDHILNHGYNLVDYDGKPTRWGQLSPDDLNRNPAWVVERGLRSFSILNYLSVAHHITNDPKYRQEYLSLALDHGYGMNGMTQPKDLAGPGSHGQNDDKMAFMNYYHLLRYETDPILLSMFNRAIRRHWQIEKYEKCPWANFIYAACCMGKVRTDQWGETDLTPPKSSLDDAIETLKRYPLDLISWPMSNAHRIDMIPLREHLGHPPGTTGYRNDGYVFPIDERHEIRWGRDPYALAGNGDGTLLELGVHYLFAYYMGRAHGLIDDTHPENLQQAGWELLWNDEFSGKRLDSTKWTLCERGTPDWKNTMSDDPRLLLIEDGILHLRGIVNDALDSDPAPYLTAGVTSKGKFSFKYGKVQIRARFISAQGAWPALWMLGDEKGWPANGEIDLMEHLNFDHIVYQTVHSEYTVSIDKTNTPKNFITARIKRDDWNTYGCEWDPDTIVFTVNDKRTHTYPRFTEKGEKQWPFNQPFYLILSMQIGGKWVNNSGPTNPMHYPADLQVDWVRIYKRKKPAECSTSDTLCFLNIPERPENALEGSEFVAKVSGMSIPDRETAAAREILSGNVPSFSRKLRSLKINQIIDAKDHELILFTACDYMAVGSDQDYVYIPLLPSTAQLLADELMCTLPTKKIVDYIYTNAGIKLFPQPIPPSDKMITIPVFRQHTDSIKQQISALGLDRSADSIISGHKKDIIISNKVYSPDRSYDRVVIYGWHSGVNDPIQPVYNGHTAKYADYSHGVRLISRLAFLNGDSIQVDDILKDPELSVLLSDEGLIGKPSYPHPFIIFQ